MSILDNVNANNAEIVAKQIIGQTRQTYNMMVNAFNSGSRNFWTNPRATPAEIAAALGNDAAEVFSLHYALGQLIGGVKPEAIAPGLAVLGQFTMNQDGTVTVIEPTTTTPEPVVTTQPPE